MFSFALAEREECSTDTVNKGFSKVAVFFVFVFFWSCLCLLLNNVNISLRHVIYMPNILQPLKFIIKLQY